MKKQNQGITLVALVITIIILLILAGIFIGTLKNNGLFENAKIAKIKYQNAQEKEQIILNGMFNENNKEIVSNRDNEGKTSQNISISNVTGTTFTINVNSVDANNTKKLYYYVDDELVYEGKEIKYEVTGLTPNKEYNVYVLGDRVDVKVKTTDADDIKSWLACIDITDDYTLEEIKANKDNTLTSLAASVEAKNYLARSTNILFPAIAESEYRDLFIENIIPDMTSNTTPSGKVAASGYYSGRDPWQAFRHVTPNLYDGSTFYASDKSTAWVSYEWDTDVTIGSIEIHQYNPTITKLQYLKDNEWVDVLSLPVISNSDAITQKTLELPNVLKTKAIRFDMANSFGGLVALSGVKVYGMQQK